MPTAIYVDCCPSSPGPTGRGFSKLSKALSRLNLRSPSEPDQHDLIQALRKEQASLLKSRHPNARHVLAHTPVPAGLSRARVRDYVRSIAITPPPHGTAFPPQCSEIVPGRLYVADGFSGTDVATLLRLRITHVVAILHAPHALHAAEAAAAVGGAGAGAGAVLLPGVVYHEVEVPYDAYRARSLVATIDDAVDFVDGALRGRGDAVGDRDGDRDRDGYEDANDGDGGGGGRVLVHCQMGVRWSPSVVIAWLMRNAQCDYERARELVVRRRPVVEPGVDLEKGVKEWWALEMARPAFPVGRGGRCRPAPAVHCVQWDFGYRGVQQEEWESDESDVLDIK